MKLNINLCGLRVRCEGSDVHEPRPARHLGRPYQLPPHPNQGSKDFDGGIKQWIKSSTNPEDNEQVPRPKLRVGTSFAGWARGGDGDSVAGKLAKTRRVSSTEGVNLPAPKGLALQEHRALAGQRIKNAKENRSEELDLENLGLKVLPEQVDALVAVHTLNLNYNMLGSLPSTIVRMVNLQQLSAGVNQIKWFPEGMGALRQLTHLDMSGNLLEHVPPEIGDLPLQELSLDWNRLTSLPKELGRLQSLQVFNAGTNLLTSVPPEMGNLRQLRRVDLSLNKGIYSLPWEWNELIAGLVKLDLSGTSFTGFHDKLPLPRRMKVVNLFGTDTRTLPKSFGTLALVNPPQVDRLRTTNSNNVITVLAGECNLAYQLAGEGRIEGKKKAQIPKLAPMRHELKRAPYTYENSMDGGDSDDGADLGHFLEFGGAAAVELEHARRAREVAVATRPPPGRVADWAAKQAAEAALPRGGVVPNQPSRPWSNDATGAVPWAQPGQTRQDWAVAGWAGRGRHGAPHMYYPWASNSQQPMAPQGGSAAQPMGLQSYVGFQGNRAPLPPLQQPMGSRQYDSFANPAGTPIQRPPPVPWSAFNPKGRTERPAWAPPRTWTETLHLTRASEAIASVNDAIGAMVEHFTE